MQQLTVTGETRGGADRAGVRTGELQRGTVRQCGVAGQQMAAAALDDDAALLEVELTGLLQAGRVVDVEGAAAGLVQRAQVVQRAAGATRVVGAEVAAAGIHRQHGAGRIAQLAGSAEVEIAAGLGDAAVAAGIGVYQRRVVQAEGRTAAADVQNARQRQRTAAADVAAGPVEIAARCGRAGNVQRAAAERDVGAQAAQVQVQGTRHHLDPRLSLVGVQIGGVASHSQQRRRQRKCRVVIDRAAANVDRVERQPGAGEGAGAVVLHEAGDVTRCVRREGAAAVQRHRVEIERALRDQLSAAVEGQVAGNRGFADHRQRATADVQVFLRNQLADGPGAGRQGDRRRVADAVDEH